MKISYAITVCNEEKEIKQLIHFLIKHIRPIDQIVVLYDYPNGNKNIEEFLYTVKPKGEYSFLRDKFKNHFADWKNKLTKHCSGDYIFQIDADEIPNKNLIDNLPAILEHNNDLDVMLVPRINTVEGLTLEHQLKWKWNVNEKGWVNWPDYQWRIWKNKPEIKWVNKVHERLDGFKTYATLPSEPEFSLKHPKTIKRQEKQNAYYESIN